jgi:hypothetical protein
MSSKTYDALKAGRRPGASKEKAREAADASQATRTDWFRTTAGLALMKGNFTITLWAMGVNTAATIVILGLLSRGQSV